MIEEIKLELNSFFNNSNIIFSKLDYPSKNELFTFMSDSNKYMLKIYNSSSSFDLELFAINHFSKYLDFVTPIIHSKKSTPSWIVTKFIKGEILKSTEDFDLYKKTISLMIRLHSLKSTLKKPLERDIVGFYDKKLQEAKKRIISFLPKEYDSTFLCSLIDNFNILYKFLFQESHNFIHGDFVDRNILINKNKLFLLDFENSRFAPSLEDLIFFLENSKLISSQKNELKELYAKFVPFDDKLFLVLSLLTKIRILGSLLRIKQDSLKEFSKRISTFIAEIQDITIHLKEYDIHLTNTILLSLVQPSDDIINPILSRFNSGNVLDLGCGTAVNSSLLSKKGFTVTCVDVSKSAINHIKSEDLSIITIESDLKNFKFKETYDVIILTGILHLVSFETAKNILSQSIVHLNKSGLLILDCFLQDSYGVGFEPTVIELKDLVSSLDIVEFKEYSQDGFKLAWILGIK